MNQTSRGKVYYDEWGEWPELKYMPDGIVKAKRWWWPPDRKKAKLLTVILNSDTFKKARFLHSQPAPNPFYAPKQELNKEVI